MTNNKLTASKILLIFIVLQLSACASTESAKQETKPLAYTWKKASEAYSEKDWREAQALYEIIVKQFPNDSEAHFRVGVSAYRQGNRNQAEKSFSEVIRLEPKSTRAAFNLSIIKLSEAYELIMQCAKNSTNESERQKYKNIAKRISELQGTSR